MPRLRHPPGIPISPCSRPEAPPLPRSGSPRVPGPCRGGGRCRRPPGCAARTRAVETGRGRDVGGSDRPGGAAAGPPSRSPLLDNSSFCLCAAFQAGSFRIPISVIPFNRISLFNKVGFQANTLPPDLCT